jgi:hypothetical protein
MQSLGSSKPKGLNSNQNFFLNDCHSVNVTTVDFIFHCLKIRITSFQQRNKIIQFPYLENKRNAFLAALKCSTVKTSFICECWHFNGMWKPLTLYIFSDIYLIFSINLVSQVTLKSNGTDIFYGCHLLRCLYNILVLYFL